VLLGFSFRKYKERWVIKIARKSIERMKDKCWAITKRNSPLSETERIEKLNRVIRGWVNYFRIAQAKVSMKNMDGKVRTRLRMCKWKEWKHIKTKRRNLLKLGAHPRDAYHWGRSSSGYCRVAQSYILCQTLTVAYFRKKGYVGFYDLYHRQTEAQITLF
jgi:hypothetical protein